MFHRHVSLSKNQKTWKDLKSDLVTQNGDRQYNRPEETAEIVFIHHQLLLSGDSNRIYATLS